MDDMMLTRKQLQDQIESFIKEAEETLLSIPFSDVKKLQDNHIEWLIRVQGYLQSLDFQGVMDYNVTSLDTQPIENITAYRRYMQSINGEIFRLKEEVLPDLLTAKLVPQVSTQKFQDPYYIEGYTKMQDIGNGGYGVVYRYHHDILDLDFAIKFYNQSVFNEDPAGLERFFQEAKILHTLNHPRIVRIYDVNIRQETPYIRMDYIHGQSLNKIGTVSLSQSIKIIKQITEGVNYAHQKQIIHRDLKESNILIDQKGDVTIIDFGIGAFIDVALDKGITATVAGSSPVFGAHTAPELYDDHRLRDNRIDIYSIGYLWFKMLTGISPKSGDVESKLTEHKVNQGIINTLSKCLKPISQRFNSCEDLLSELNAISL